MSLSIQINRIVKKKIPQFVDGKTMWATSGYQVYRSPDKGVSWKVLGKISVPPTRKALCSCPPLARLLRLGIYNLLVLKSGNILASTSGLFHYSEDGGRTFYATHRMRVGRKPLHRGICEDKHGNVYYGEYYINPKRNEKINIYKSIDGGKSFQVVHTFPAGTICHIHFVQYDPYTDRLWIGAGDRDAECFIAYSEDGGNTFHKIGEGDQRWRAVSLVFTERYVYWGSDAGYCAPHAKNFIYRWDRNSQTLNVGQQVDGPIYYSTVLPNGIILMGTSVERGENELDSCAHLWASSDGDNWVDLIGWKKDFWPRIVSHGIIRFPHGQSDIDNEFHFYLVGLCASQGIYCAQISTNL
jgi:hypothetical protein